MPSNEQVLKEITVGQVPGVGSKTASKLNHLGLYSLFDVLLHLPRRYLDKTRITPLADCRNGDVIQAQATILQSQMRLKPKRYFVITVSDETSQAQLKFFYSHPSQRNELLTGRIIRFSGKVQFFQGSAQFIHPSYELLAAEDAPLAETFEAIYPTTEGVSQALLRKLAVYAIKTLTTLPIDEWMSKEQLSQHGCLPITEAIPLMHAPPPNVSIEKLQARSHPAQKRLQLDELLAHHLSAKQVKLYLLHYKAHPLTLDNPLRTALLKQLPFELTNAQKKVLKEIQHDLQHPHPMSRLLQGDVGSGKTIVAAICLLAACAEKKQAALMAPTEVLAEQHFQTLAPLLTPLGLTVICLTAQVSAAEKKSYYQQIAQGKIDIVIGTHALIQDAVHFKDLALCIIDEQHRFGVKQRLALLEKTNPGQHRPHLLLMTATPIPRTLAMTLFAELDTSVIDELPPGRTPIKTSAIPVSRQADVLSRLKEHLTQGEQAYWVCTLIEESEVLHAKACQAAYEELSEVLAPISIGLLHGRMKSAEKQQIMHDFKSGKLKLLIATTVIEVGVDVPNASLMVIENPERLGLAQLHQLRGRIGRGNKQSYCLLLYASPLSEDGKFRLDTLRTNTCGFKIAEADLKLRGPGQWLGTDQSGLPSLKIADLSLDAALFPLVQHLGEQLSKDTALSKAIINRWLQHKEIFAVQ